MRESDIRITPSIIDRLIDLEPKNSREAEKSRAQGLAELKQSVRRDLEWLLNTRYKSSDVPEGLEEVNHSMAIYGLPDFTGWSSKDENERRDLVQSIETALRVFEPRLANVQVELDELDKVRRGIRFRIKANLQVEPVPEPMVFDTVLETGSGNFEVE